jgi:hypothetical protein
LVLCSFQAEPFAEFNSAIQQNIILRYERAFRLEIQRGRGHLGHVAHVAEWQTRQT